MNTVLVPQRRCNGEKHETWKIPLRIPFRPRISPIVGVSSPNPPSDIGVDRIRGWRNKKEIAS
jgi:hypothetical protein